MSHEVSDGCLYLCPSWHDRRPVLDRVTRDRGLESASNPNQELPVYTQTRGRVMGEPTRRNLRRKKKGAKDSPCVPHTLSALHTGVSHVSYCIASETWLGGPIIFVDC